MQWLNPGYSDESVYEDNLNAVAWLLSRRAVLAKRNVMNPNEAIVEDIRQQVLGKSHVSWFGKNRVQTMASIGSWHTAATPAETRVSN